MAVAIIAPEIGVKAAACVFTAFSIVAERFANLLQFHADTRAAQVKRLARQPDGGCSHESFFAYAKIHQGAYAWYRPSRFGGGQ